MAHIAKKIRAAAIADLLAGEQPAAVAATYGLDPTIVRQWKTRYENDTLHPRPGKRTGTP